MKVSKHYDIYSHKLFYAITRFTDQDEPTADQVFISAYYPYNEDEEFNLVLDVMESAEKVASYSIKLRRHDVKGFFNFHDDLFNWMVRLNSDHSMRSAVHNFLMFSQIGKFDGTSSIMEVK